MCFVRLNLNFTVKRSRPSVDLKGRQCSSLCVCLLVNLVLVGPVEVKSMWIHVQSHWTNSGQILKRKTIKKSR